jgi:hypothetical protein
METEVVHTFDRAINATGTGLTELGVKFFQKTPRTPSPEAQRFIRK